MNEIEVFSNSQFGTVRAAEIDGEPWFCLADVCKPLGLEASKCKNRLKVDGLLTREGVDSMGRKNTMLWCNEGNLYRAIFQSKKPEAEAFTDWVTEEVLPSLRKNGTYSVPHAAPSVSPSGLARLISITRRVMLDMGNTPQEVGQMVHGMFETWNVPLPASFKAQLPGQLSIWEQGKLTGGQ